jgi:cysteinyl-tRNA synthetase, unknown class
MKRSILPAAFIVLASCGAGDGDGDGDSSPTDVDTGSAPETSTVLNGVEISNFMYQLQELYDTDRVDELDATQYDMLVVEPGFNFSEFPYDTDYMVSQLKTKPNGDERIVLAYIDIGQAEDYRDYWLTQETDPAENWQAPTLGNPGYPDFIVSTDPDGWAGNYPVAYWSPGWKDLWLETDGIIERIADYGFDGIYLDWVEAYDDDDVIARAEAGSMDAAAEMIGFIEEMKAKAQPIKSDFLVIAQNAPYLLDTNPARYASAIDAIATEDTWCFGEGDVGWDDANAGDLTGGDRHAGDYSTASRIAQNRKYLDLGIPVFTVDYCISQNNADQVYQDSRTNGFIPLVTRVSLSQITETPPF